WDHPRCEPLDGPPVRLSGAGIPRNGTGPAFLQTFCLGELPGNDRPAWIGKRQRGGNEEEGWTDDLLSAERMKLIRSRRQRNLLSGYPPRHYRTETGRNTFPPERKAGSNRPRGADDRTRGTQSVNECKPCDQSAKERHRGRCGKPGILF